jgi:Heterokaryon incompatibility protein (HET)
MDKKRNRADNNDVQPCRDELRPLKQIKWERSEAGDITNPAAAHELTLEQPNQPVVDQGQVYPERLGEGTVRILVLHPGSASDDIKCHLGQKVPLAQVPLDEVLIYDALSYVWGDEKNPDFIDLCGSRFAVTRNLAEALRQLRFPSSERMLWVDALCINQCDEEEKKAQVNSMHWIYKLARSVIAWLGPSNEDCRSAFGTMDLIQKLDITPISGVMTCRISNKETRNGHDPFRELMDRPYWSRAWIVQEMMFAHSLLIQCGAEVVRYSTLEKVYPPDKQGYMETYSDESEPMRIHFRGGPELKILRLDSEQICPKRFLDCFLDRECLNRHDNIFAFLNLLSNDIREQIDVTWKEDIRKLIRHTAEVIIKSTQSLYIIVIRGRQTPPCAQGDDKWQLDMPSWCPYFATPYDCCSIQPQENPSLFAEKAVLSFASGRLAVKGFVIGRISRTISRNMQPGVGKTTWWDQADIDRERKHYRKCLDLGLNGMPKDDHTRLMSIDATTRTLFAGQGEGFLDLQTLVTSSSTENVEGPEIVALRKIWDMGNSRLVCSFRLGRATKRALYSSKAAPAAWINQIALVPRTVRPGDAICTILGCPTPVVLRRMGKRYHVLGEAYVDTSAMGWFKVAVGLREFVLE